MSHGKRALYMCGQLGMMALARYFFTWILAFARGQPPGAEEGDGAKTLLSVAVVGWIVFGFRIFDGVTDPLAGGAADAWVRRGRHRRGLLWFSFLVPPIGLALCFLPTHGMDEWLRWTLVVGGMFLFFLGYTFYAIPYWSLIDDYSEGDPDERRVLSNLLGAGLLLATAVGAIVSPLVIAEYGYAVGALSFAIPAAGLMTLPYFAKPSAPPEEEAKRKAEAERRGPPSPPPPLLAQIKAALGHRHFVAVLILFAGSQMSFTVMTSAAPFIATDLLGADEAAVAKLLGPFLVVAILFFSVTPTISRRLGWELAVVLASVALACVYGATAGLGQAIVGSPVTTAMCVFGLGGPMAAILLGLEGEAITACARARDPNAVGIYFGVFNFLVKAMNGLALGLTGFLADRSTQAAPEGGGLVYDAFAVRAMGLAAGGLLVLCVVLYFLVRPRAPATEGTADEALEADDAPPADDPKADDPG